MKVEGYSCDMPSFEAPSRHAVYNMAYVKNVKLLSNSNFTVMKDGFI